MSFQRANTKLFPYFSSSEYLKKLHLIYGMRGAVPSYVFLVRCLIKHKNTLTLTLFTSSICWTLSPDNESSPQPHTLFSNPILIWSLYFHTVPHISNDIFLSGELVKISYLFVISCMFCACHLPSMLSSLRDRFLWLSENELGLQGSGLLTEATG
jgi:hypothetical protein